MVFESHASAVGPGVAAAVHHDDQDRGFLWIADGNERDPNGSGLGCAVVREFLANQDLMTADLGQLIAQIDRDVLPAAARAHGVSALALGLLVGRVAGRSVTVAFVGEARAHVVAADGRLVFVSHEHNVYSQYPESVWRDELRYSEEDAKLTVLGVVGGGTADVEVHVLPRGPHGALIGAAHLWHHYAQPASYLERLQRLAGGGEDGQGLTPGQAVAVVRW